MRYAIFALLTVLCLGFNTLANVIVFEQPSSPTGGIHKSAWYPPDGLDGDEYAFDNFTLASSAAISEIHWRGGYTNYLSGAGRAPVSAFTISIYRSIAAGSQPDLGAGGRLVQYNVNSNAGETPVAIIGGVQMYDYAFTLATPFPAAGGTKYWVQIEASQGVTATYGWPPDWGLCTATGGDSSYMRRITGGPIQMLAADLAFSLYTSGAPTVNIAATASPAAAGIITGAGPYPVNSTASLNAAANAGWGFVNWTQSGSQVSTNAHYTFTTTVDRTLVANFVPSFTITTSSFPVYGGTTTGGGAFNSGSTVTLIATPNHGFVFTGWSDGAPEASHSFPASADVQLTAFFVSAPNSVTFDFNAAPQYTPFPIDQSVSGLTAHFAGGYSIQQVGAVGIAPMGFSGNCIFPNSVYGADILISFSRTLTDFSILYSTQELGCDSSATMRVTAYQNTALVATATTTAPVPGTWPSGTLAIAAPSGFNNVVVHYDARPPTCADYGVIFLADNVTVTMMPVPVCPADFNGVGGITVQDIFDFLAAWFAGDIRADFNTSGTLSVQDIFDFLAAWFAGCP